MPVKLEVESPDDFNHLQDSRVTVVAYNEGGYNSVAIDAEELYQALTKWRIDHRIATYDYPTSEARYADFSEWLAAQT